MWDVFISHAWEDKESIARPLANALTNSGLLVWYDEFSLTLGDSLRRSIDQGLTESRYGVVILSPFFFIKNWPQRELDGLVAKEISTGKTILPVWHNVNRDDVIKFSITLGDKLGVPTSSGLENVVKEILKAVRLSNSSVINHNFPSAKPAQATNENRLNFSTQSTRYSLENFQKLYNFAYSGDGFNMLSSEAKEWANKYSNQNIDIDAVITRFKKFNSFAYSGDGLNMLGSESKEWAKERMFKNINADAMIKRFKELNDLAYSGDGLNMLGSEAKAWALKRMEIPGDSSNIKSRYKELYNYAYSGNGLNMLGSEARAWALEKLIQEHPDLA